MEATKAHYLANTHILEFIPVYIVVSHNAIQQLIDSSEECYFKDDCSNFVKILNVVVAALLFIIGLIKIIGGYYFVPAFRTQINKQYRSVSIYFILKIFALGMYIVVVNPQPLAGFVDREHASKLSVIKGISVIFGTIIIAMLSAVASSFVKNICKIYVYIFIPIFLRIMNGIYNIGNPYDSVLHEMNQPIQVKSMSVDDTIHDDIKMSDPDDEQP